MKSKKRIVENERKRQGKEGTPSLLAIDSQSVKKVQFTNEETGIDGGKNVNGRKRTILVDSLGLPWSIKVTAANISDNQAGILAVDLLAGKVPRLKKITADSGYKVASHGKDVCGVGRTQTGLSDFAKPDTGG